MGWFLRMARWVRHPPSMGQVKFLLVILTICALIFTYEQIFGWPEALTPDRTPRVPRF